LPAEASVQSADDSDTEIPICCLQQNDILIDSPQRQSTMINPFPSDNPMLKRMALVVAGLAMLVAIGTTGYRFIEGWPLQDCFFMTVITMSTVGYSEPHALSQMGRWFTSGLIFLCLVGMTGWTAVLTSFIVESDLSGYFQRRKMVKMISALKDHTIVCGSGPMALAVIERLMRRRVDVVVVDEDEPRLEELKKRFRTLHFVVGKGSNELLLARANVLNARHVVAAMDSELDNLLIGITCKDMGDNISVIARANDIAIANRMRKSGIDEVISPVQLGGERVAELIS
jgi:voltage-gated potassium channel